MPNWCSTDITIHGEPEEIKTLWYHLQAATSKSFVENGFGDTWLGNIVEYLGKSFRDVNCRGSICDMEMSGDSIICISQEDAWSPKLMPIKMLMDKYAPDASLFFVAEEPGCDLYDTNDPDFIGMWQVSIWSNYDELPKELYDEDLMKPTRLKAILSKFLQKNGTLSELTAMMSERYDGDIDFHEFEECEIENYL